MSEQISVGVVGGSGLVGGELLRLLHLHPRTKIQDVTSNSLRGKPLKSAHPWLRGISDARFVDVDDIGQYDVLFLALPHGEAMKNIDIFAGSANCLIDLSADFRLSDVESYELYYGRPHDTPDYLRKFVYGIPELQDMRGEKFISSAGCNATATILALSPIKESIESIVVDVKVGASEAGKYGGSYIEKTRSLRSYKPTGHRHVAEIKQELGIESVHMSATSTDVVRGVLATIHVFSQKPLEDVDLWKTYRAYSGRHHFVRLVKEMKGEFRYPDPKILAGSNYLDVGFETDEEGVRSVVISAIDNLMKGAAGQAIQAMNITLGLDEELGLEFPGIMY